MNGLEVLQKMAQADTTTEDDDELMQALLRHVGFKQARVVCGIVYLKGRGTLDAPPTSIRTVAKSLLNRL
jgi:hypothetical protein